MPETQGFRVTDRPTESGCAVFDADHKFVSACSGFFDVAARHGVMLAVGTSLSELFGLDDAAAQRLSASGKITFYRASGNGLLTDFQAVTTDAGSLVMTCRDNAADIRERETQDGRERVLNLAAEGGRSLSDLADALLLEAERVNPGMKCTLLRAEHEEGVLRHLSAPSLPSFFTEAVDGVAYGPGVGSCGNTVALAEDTFVDDVHTHPNWAPFRGLCADAGLKSCWSTPVLDKNHRVIAAFAMYGKEVRQPDAWEISFMHSTARLMGILWQQWATEERIRRIASHDHLTDLPNRRSFRTKLRAELARCQGRLHVFFMDLDHFKEVNDTLGHPIGDRLLVQISRRLRNFLGAKCFLARLGGDEFAVIVPEDADPVDEIAASVIDVMTDPFQLDGNLIEIGVSVGIARAPQDGLDPQILMRRADIAMFEAKNTGRNKCRRFDPEMSVKLERERTMRQALEHSVSTGDGLYLAFQPQINLRTGLVDGCEVLCRWQHPKLGQVPPETFIEAAERKGLIVRLSDWILRAAVAQARDWRERHGLDIKIAINCSAVCFRRPGLVEEMLEVIEDAGEPPSRYEIEITEGVMMEDTSQTLEILDGFKQAGMTVAVDDFGTGYSSLSYLRRFPIDRLKLDRSFIAELTEEEGSARLVCAVIRLAHGLGHKVVGEGTETLDQVQFLRENGCDTAQGFHFAKAMSGEQFAQWCLELRKTTGEMDVRRTVPLTLAPASDGF